MNESVSAATVLGFDFGLRYIGVAVGQTVTGTANPLETLKARQGEPIWDRIAGLIDHWRPSVLMVGVPLTASGAEQPITQAARRFAENLGVHFALPVLMIDERYTTLEAKQDLFERGGFRALKKSRIDAWSAKIITENGLRQWTKDIFFQ